MAPERLPDPLLAVAAFVLGVGFQLANGGLSPVALTCLSIGLTTTALAVSRVRFPGSERWCEKALPHLLITGLLIQLVLLVGKPPGIHLVHGAWQTPGMFHVGVGVGVVLVGVGMSAFPWGKPTFPLLLVLYALLGTWLIHASPSPFIDVYVFQRGAIPEFLRGGNPYRLTIENIYGHSAYYGPGIVEGTRVLVGYPYPPLNLFLTLPAALAGVDLRCAHLVASAAAAALMACARPSPLALVAAAMFLFTPRAFFVLEQSWTEPFVVLALSLTVFCACRFPRLAPYALGMLLSTKQYVLLVLPLVPLLLPTPLKAADLVKLVGRAVAVAVIVNVPFLLWDARALYHCLVTFQVQAPFRGDALTYLAWLSRRATPIGVTGWPGFVLVAPAIALTLWRTPRTPSGFAAGVAFVLLAFFAFNKMAFANYYYLVIGALCLAIAAASRTYTETSGTPSSVNTSAGATCP